VSARSEDERAAWAEACRAREARAAYLFGGLVIFLNPFWIAFDYALEPQAMRTFLGLRVASSLLCAICILVVRRGRTLHTVRLATWAMFVGTCLAIGWMLPGAQHHFWPYVAGFSLIVWGAGGVFAWPARFAWHAYLMPPLVVIAAYVLQPWWHPALELLGSGFYLVSVSIISFAVGLLRNRLLGREFRASFLLAKRNRELSEALGRLKDAQARLVASEKLSALGQLLAGLSHEINNPMNVIANNLRPMRDYLRTLENLLDLHRSAVVDLPAGGARLQGAYADADADFVRGDFHDAFDEIEEAAQRILAIHDNLRSFIRGDAPRSDHGDINEGLRATVAILKRTLPRGVELREDYGSVPPVRARFDELNQVHYNLLQNAIDAVGRAGVVQVTTRRRAHAVELAVADTGPGVPARVRDHMFDPFFTTKDVGKGTGLGLSICHRIVDDHGGTIAIDAEYHQGARLVVTLPVTTAPPPAGGAPAH
jgi:signal transduction histidine kinase